MWRGVACSVYGALWWDPSGVHSICNVYQAFGLVFFFFFLPISSVRSVLGALGRDPCGVYSVSSFLLGIGVGHLWRFSAFVVYMRDAGWSFYFIYLFIFCVALRVTFMGHWGGTLVAFTVLVGFYWALGLDVCGAFQRL